MSSKQDYYTYGALAHLWFYHDPPALGHGVEEATRREGLDRVYRIVWGGVCILRDDPASPSGEIKGDRRAVEVDPHTGRLQPTYLYGRARQIKSEWWCYEDSFGRKVRCARPDLIPPGYMVWQETEYVYAEYGILRWHVEYLCGGEWHWIQTVEDEEGRYCDADLSLVRVLREREYQNRNEDLKQIVARDREYRSRIRRDREELEERKKRERVDEMVKDLFSNLERRPVYSLP
jgi:hypothetical protein